MTNDKRSRNRAYASIEAWKTDFAQSRACALVRRCCAAADSRPGETSFADIVISNDPRPFSHRELVERSPISEGRRGAELRTLSTIPTHDGKRAPSKV
jgi:hypothetical protein